MLALPGADFFFQDPGITRGENFYPLPTMVG
jgi:hypothetical protein